MQRIPKPSAAGGEKFFEPPQPGAQPAWAGVPINREGKRMQKSLAALAPGRAVEALQPLFDDLLTRDESPAASELVQLLHDNPIGLEDIRSILDFHPAGYTRKRLL